MASSDDPTEDMIRREIAEAARILREDGHATRLSAIEAKLSKHFPDEDDEADDGKPKPPRRTEPKPSGSRKSSIWWGDQIDG